MMCGYLAYSFDLLNVGDLDVIRQAREQCDRLVVGVYSDESVEQYNGRPPVVPLVERLELIRHLRGVDEVVIHDQKKPPARGGSQVVFSVGEIDQPAPLGTVPITPTRRSESGPLLEALAPVGRVGVA